MLTTFFLTATLVAPLPIVPVVVEAGVVLEAKAPDTLDIIVGVNFPRPKTGREYYLEWNLDAPEGVLLLEIRLRAETRKPQQGPWQLTVFREYEYPVRLLGPIREVWLRDAYGRVLRRTPVKNK
jgi:hypothetical protein